MGNGVEARLGLCVIAKLEEPNQVIADLLRRLQADPGLRTLGQLLQERESARFVIEQLQSELQSMRALDKLHQHQRPYVGPVGSKTVAKESFRPRGLLRLAEVCELLAVSRSTIYRRVSDGSFPAPIRLGSHSVRWRLEEVQAWRDALSGGST